MKARDAALIELDRTRLPGWRGGVVRGRAAVNADHLDPRDRALAEQIRVGVIKNLLLLQHLIPHHSGRSLKSIDEIVQKVLAVGLYQLRFLSRIPASAAVDEAVEQARRLGQPRATGFVNAVLRNAIRNPDPPMSPDIALSHPPVLMRRLHELLETDERVLQFCRHDNSEPPTIVRMMAGTRPEQLSDPSVMVLAHEQPGMYVVTGAKRALLSAWARSGVAQPQDPTSAAVVEHLDLRPGQRVLDRCAGLGTKTIQIVERIGASGTVLAVDPNAQRMQGLRRLLEEHAISNVSVLETDSIDAHAMQPFERILVDSPCSNSGVLARRPEARYSQDDRTLQSIRKLQLDILSNTAPCLASGGLLVYSTCSVWPQENQAVIESFLASHPGFRRVRQCSTLPSIETESPQRYHDGGYFAVLLRED